MPQVSHHRTARVPNEPFRVAGLTIPQLVAMAGAFALGAGGWWVLGQVHVGGIGFFFIRSIGAGLVAGLLGLLAYATFDAGREPVVRQALGYLVRRHVYGHEESPHGSAVVPFPAHRATTPAKALASLAPARRLAVRITRFRPPRWT